MRQNKTQRRYGNFLVGIGNTVQMQYCPTRDAGSLTAAAVTGAGEATSNFHRKEKKSYIIKRYNENAATTAAAVQQ